MAYNLARQLTQLGVASVLSLGSAWTFYTLWMESEWMNFGGPFPRGWKGYTLADFIYIFQFTLLGPVSMFCMVGFFQAMVRKYVTVSRSSFLMVSGLYLSFLLSHAVFGFYVARDLVRCGVIFCIHGEGEENKMKPYSTLQPEAAMGFKSTIGLSYGFGCTLLLIGVLSNCIVQYKRLYVNKGNNSYRNFQTDANSSVLVKDPMAGMFKALVLGTTIVGGFLFFLTTLYIPNNWEYMSAFRIARFAGLIATTDKDLCARWTEYTCPEIAHASMRTWNIAVYDNFNLKVFPSNAIFYATLLFFVLFAYISTSVPAFKRAMDKKVRIGSKRRLAYFTIRELVCIAVTGIMAYLFFAYWFFSHNWNNYWPSEEPALQERWARTFGQVAVFFLGLLMFPTARNSPILALAGVSWEAAIKYHRWLGVLFFLATIGHVVATYCWYAVHSLFPKEIYSIPNSLPTSVDNFTVPMIQFIVYIMLVTIGVMAIYEPFRRKHFDLFMFAHHFTYLTLIPAVLWHAQASWEYILPGVGIWFVERVVRLFRSSQAYPLPLHINHNNFVINDSAYVSCVRAYSAGAAGEFTELRIPAPDFKYLPGQYVFLNVMEVSLVEWHPFTIMSPVHSTASKEVGLCIKAMGPGTWTQSLYSLINAQQNAGQNPTITVSLDGPYGHPIDYTQYDAVFLVGGGIGVTPCKSIFESLYLAKSRSAHLDDSRLSHTGLFFAARDAELFSIVQPCLNSISAAHSSSFTAKLYLNNPDRTITQDEISTHPLAQYMVIGSRSLSDDLREAASLVTPTTEEQPRILLFVCGPEGLAKSMEDLAYECQWDFHTETFAL